MGAAGKEVGKAPMSMMVGPSCDGGLGAAGGDGGDGGYALDPWEITKILGDAANKGVVDDLTEVEDDQEGDGREALRPRWWFQCDGGTFQGKRGEKKKEPLFPEDVKSSSAEGGLNFLKKMLRLRLGKMNYRLGKH